jgi:hypothetical protein
MLSFFPWAATSVTSSQPDTQDELLLPSMSKRILITSTDSSSSTSGTHPPALPLFRPGAFLSLSAVPFPCLLQQAVVHCIEQVITRSPAANHARHLSPPLLPHQHPRLQRSTSPTLLASYHLLLPQPCLLPLMINAVYESSPLHLKRSRV